MRFSWLLRQDKGGFLLRRCWERETASNCFKQLEHMVISSENAVFFLLLIGLLEVSGAVSNLTIGILGDLFLLARIFHAYGILQPEAVSIFRTIGAGASMLVLIILAALAIWISGSWLLANNWGF